MLGLKYLKCINTQALQRCWKTGALRQALLAGIDQARDQEWLQWSRSSLSLLFGSQNNPTGFPGPLQVTKPFMLPQMNGEGADRIYT